VRSIAEAPEGWAAVPVLVLVLYVVGVAYLGMMNGLKNPYSMSDDGLVVRARVVPIHRKNAHWSSCGGGCLYRLNENRRSRETERDGVRV
jgi:hypothetical protein